MLYLFSSSSYALTPEEINKKIKKDDAKDFLKAIYYTTDELYWIHYMEYSYTIYTLMGRAGHVTQLAVRYILYFLPCVQVTQYHPCMLHLEAKNLQ